MTYSIKQLLSHRRRLSSRFAKRSRKLSSGEVKLARSVFGDSINLDAVQLKTAWWVLKNYAVSPNGNIYFHPEDWVVDFGHTSISKQSWLIHELTHVWQLQQGLKVVRGALINRRYEYDLKLGKPFFKYGIEQQARMVQDYFVRRQLGKNCQDLQACIPFLTIDPVIKDDKSFTV
ncbi:type IV secretion protein Rhs [Psychrobacter sp. FBL11]|uniref:Type IV secretion protein Rhs n=1 Tax=Psychrobacter saeujeotis TaxID=3143436 RepID=A0ABU9X8U3_9GAMM|nr:type IV secretion protein Rhs [uncultured Psychrobacter sp.]